MFIHDELNYDRGKLVEEHVQLMSTMTIEQQKVYDKIMTRVNQIKPGVFFLHGYGGTGKTFIWRDLPTALRSKGEIVLTVASSGIAALLIAGGRTTHSRFCILIDIHECSTCSMYPDTPLAALIIKTKLIIWDEAPMMHKHCFEAVDRSLRDILKTVDAKNKNIPFGGKVVVFGGDFRQILPVILVDPSLRDILKTVVHATINSSYIWDFCEVLTLSKNMRLLRGSSDAYIEERRLFSDWILGIGDGTIGDSNDVDIEVNIPSYLLIKSSGNNLASIVTYPKMVEKFNC